MDTTFGTTILDTMSNDKLQSSTRASIDGFEDENQVPVTFTVIHSGDIDQMSKSDESDFKALLEAYGLEMRESFDIDEENRGIVLVASSKLMAPIEVGKEISMVDQVLMVEVGNVDREGGVS
jgi:hypothetical protein